MNDRYGFGSVATAFALGMLVTSVLALWTRTPGPPPISMPRAEAAATADTEKLVAAKAELAFAAAVAHGMIVQTPDGKLAITRPAAAPQAATP